jgi:hypothetical protein
MSDDPDGLTQVEAAKRLRANGANTVADVGRHPLRDVISKFWAPVPWLLEAAIVLQIVLHDYLEAVAVFGLLAFNGVLGFSRRPSCEFVACNSSDFLWPEISSSRWPKIGYTVMAPLPWAVVGSVLGAALIFGMLLNLLKLPLFTRLKIS